MFKNMKLRQKLMFGAGSLAIVPIIIASLALGWTAIDNAKVALEERSKAQLVSLRALKAGEITGYFNTIRDQVLTLSNDRMIIDFARQLPKAFRNYPSDFAEGENTESLRSSLSSYYHQQFTPEFNNLNKGESSPASGWLDRLDKEGVALQYQFIKANPSPLGSKNGLSDPNDGTSYGRLHATYHPHINDYLEKFGYYDIFIADPETGDIIYSVYKELDFATSLKSGPFANTGIGKVFQQVVNSSSTEAVAVTDFDTYAPSYNGAASFIASPIYDGGKMLGVLIFQMPIDRINQVMTSNENWEEAGLGASGETYLVGPDRLMRSQSRFLIEDKAGYMEALRDAGTSNRTLETIEAKDTSIGIAEVSSESAVKALAGQSGYHIIPDYRGVPVLSAYAPVDILGMRWALLAEIDEEEAFAANVKLEESILTSAVSISVVIAVLASLIGMFFANSITTPIVASVNLAQQISKGDLTADIDVKGTDEIGQLQLALREMKDNLYNIVGSAMDSTNTVNAAAEQIVKGNLDLSQRTEEQASSLEETASSMEEMASTVTQNSDNAGKANDIAITARDQAMEGGEIVEKAVIAMSEINASSSRMADIVGVIDDIAFQTNLLALNAAVEAARAGDQGRGFAVVASEVRTLAQRSAESAKEIKGLISDSIEKVGQGSDLVNQSGESLLQIVEGVKSVATIVSEIAAASAEQSAGAEQVNKAVTQMDEMTQQNAALVEEAAAAAQAMRDQTTNLNQQMQFFKLGDRYQSSQASAVPTYESQVPVQPQAPARPAAPASAKPSAATAGARRKAIATTADKENGDWEEF